MFILGIIQEKKICLSLEMKTVQKPDRRDEQETGALGGGGGGGGGLNLFVKLVLLMFTARWNFWFSNVWISPP